jgi:DNA-binding NtrC family response regulator
VGSNQRVKVDVRVIAATNRDLEAAYKNKTFREDLYFRLNVVAVHVPALRERRSDIPMLVNWFCERYAPGAELRVSNAAMKALMNYDWPGNVRELENCIERAIALGTGNVMQFTDLPSNLQYDARERAPEDGEMVPLMVLERRAIFRAMRETNGDKLAAARMLGIGKTTLYRKLKQYDSQPAN